MGWGRVHFVIAERLHPGQESWYILAHLYLRLRYRMEIDTKTYPRVPIAIKENFALIAIAFACRGSS
jgi:hypothetical protein